MLVDSERLQGQFSSSSRPLHAEPRMPNPGRTAEWYLTRPALLTQGMTFFVIG